MHEVTRILTAINQGDSSSASQLLPLVYEELRKLAVARLNQEAAGQTLQATALVHEAYLRLVDQPDSQQWDSRGHFFAAAAEAMRRILVENARSKQRLKHGGEFNRQELDDIPDIGSDIKEDLLALDAALTKLSAENQQASMLIQLRYFAGMAIPDVADALKISPRTAARLWTYARAWLLREIHGSD